MNLHDHGAARARAGVRRTNTASGLTIVEMLVATAIGGLVLAVVGMLTVYALQSFVAMGNYASLDARSRSALDRMTRDIRQATRVKSFYADDTTKWLKLATPDPDLTIKYTWYADDHTLVCEKGGEQEIYLTECEEWNFVLCQRTPQPGSTDVFYPAMNCANACDPATCKVIDMTWRCTRTFLGKKSKTESVQAARFVLRNKS